MPFLIDANDKIDGKALREQVRPAHLDFLVSRQAVLLAAGAKLSDDGATALGSAYIVDTDQRAEAEAFIADDPFSKAGLFASVAITRWRKGFFNFERQPASGG